jgi:hypothetical protein
MHKPRTTTVLDRERRREPGDIFVTDLPATATSRELSQIGIRDNRQDFAITGISGENAASQGVLIRGAGGTIYTMPGGSRLQGCFTIICR